MNYSQRFVIVLLVFSLLVSCKTKETKEKSTAHLTHKPNVLMIMVDDLNDWVGHLGGHPNGSTPHIDNLAARGTYFLNAHANAPICGPSRASLLTGVYPATSGLYFHVDDIDLNTMVEKDTTGLIFLPDHFKKQGYQTYGVGKVFHLGDKAGVFDEYGGLSNFGPKPKMRFKYDPEWFGKPKGTSTDWGIYPENDTLTFDHRIAEWAIKRLAEPSKNPFFMAVGFMRPHVPWYVSQKWMDTFPLDSVQLPKYQKDDWDDIPPFARAVTSWPMMPEMEWMQQENRWREAVQAYLASMKFVDYQVGRVLDALKVNGKDSNTIVLLVSDHGYHLGEKGLFQKGTLWKRSTHIPMVWSGPGIKKGSSKTPVSLIDIYPTLSELCGIEAPNYLEGKSLAPILKDNAFKLENHVLATHGPKNYSVYRDKWHYITYADGSEELYNLYEDQQEWHNLAKDVNFKLTLDSLKSLVPKYGAPNRFISQLCATPLYFDPVKCDEEPQ